MKGRLIYGYFRHEEGAKKHLQKMKKAEKGSKRSFVYRCEKRDRLKEGRKRWLAYRLVSKAQL